MLRYLGDTECSLYNLIGALVGYISVLDFGISNAIIRYVAKYRLEGEEQEQRRFLGMAFVLYTFFAILVIIVGLIVALLFCLMRLQTAPIPMPIFKKPC